MAVPDFQSLMLPLLGVSADGQEHRLADARGALAVELELDDRDREERLPSGRQSKLANRVAWAKVYLAQAGLLLSTRRGTFRSRTGAATFSRLDPGASTSRSWDSTQSSSSSESRRLRSGCLGLDVVYLQAKQWEGTVGRPEIQTFVGALHGKRARKGVFITTGVFSADAASYVDRIEPKVVLIDGRRLAELMIDFEVGVATAQTYHVKRIDSDYFDDE